MHNAIRRELRVAFSKKAQPPLFRVIKWVVFMAGTALISRTGFFRYWVIGLPLLSIMVHFVYRWKTHGWTRPRNPGGYRRCDDEGVQPGEMEDPDRRKIR